MNEEISIMNEVISIMNEGISIMNEGISIMMNGTFYNERYFYDGMLCLMRSSTSCC